MEWNYRCFSCGRALGDVAFYDHVLSFEMQYWSKSLSKLFAGKADRANSLLYGKLGSAAAHQPLLSKWQE